jgi:SynChlorMet cassette radical SAM/SPASM protein ScmE
MPLDVMRTPRSLDLEITSRCNANCSYCYYLNNPDVDYAELPTDSWLAFFAELARCQVMNVTLQGGEPLIREDFLTLVDGLVSNRMRFSVLTNGSLMSPQIATHLKSTGRCDQVQVSLDGSTADIHEKLRGEGTFLPALAAIRLLQDFEIPVTVRVTIHPGNLDDLESVTRLLLDDLKLPGFSTNAASSLGTSAKYGSESLLTSIDRLKAMRSLATLETAYPGRIQASAGPLADWHAFHAMEEARQNDQPIPGRGRLVGCGCIFDRLAVRADGAITPCVMLPQMVLGRIGEDRLDDVWKNSQALQEMRSRCSVPLATFEECQDCSWRESCTGNCPGTAYSLTGEVDRPCPEACLKRFHNDISALGESLWT